MNIVLANPRGFCAGVDRAIDIVKSALVKFGAPIYVRHEVVHNRFVVEGLKREGAVFVDELEQVPDDSIVIFSAHGVSLKVQEQAASRNLQLVFDATCPLVSKVHMEVIRYSRKGHEVVLIGHAGHAEVEGTLGQYTNPEGAIYLIESIDDVEHLAIRNPEACSYVTQTTLSVDDTLHIIDSLRKKYPLIQGPKKDDICYATQNRQDAVRALSAQCDAILVVGSKSSSNSNRLKELAEQMGVRSQLIDSEHEIDLDWLKNCKQLGITAGASAPEVLVQNVVSFVSKHFHVDSVSNLAGLEEHVSFALPKELKGVLTLQAV